MSPSARASIAYFPFLRAQWLWLGWLSVFPEKGTCSLPRTYPQNNQNCMMPYFRKESRSQTLTLLHIVVSADIWSIQ
ncbi:hypothetical protein M408DRAFT_102648 [Serendipita vermifera MAFF 305830]|uniref:Secreted protein n=1 Tax=Serendipita vermifera MAFF 305830 TaxID=933852 RepID=A0A0C2WW17_SERVB|nr:hypothetical protein M408DRAFT_102648 [Serendipita vermifera MAFF 305830]